MADVQVVLEGVDNLSGVVNAVSAVFSGNLTAALDLAMKGLGAVSDAFTGFLKSAIEGEDATTALDFALNKQGAGAVITADHAQRLAESLKNLVGGQNDTVISAESVLLKFKEINSSAFPGALKLSADLAASMGTDMSSAAQTLGKALENPTTAMRLIKTVGGEVDPEFQKIIKRMVSMGDIADADSAIMNKLNDVIGGKAVSVASTLSGEWKTMMGNLSDLGQKIGDDFLPVLHTLFDTVMKPAIATVEAWGNKLAEALSVFKSGDLKAGITNLYTNLLIAVPVLQQVQTAFFGVTDFIQKNWPSLQATVRLAFQDMQQVGGLLVDFVQKTFIPAVQGITGVTSVALPSAQNVFDGVMRAINISLGKTVDFVRENVIPTFTEIVHWVTEHWPQMRDTAVSVFNMIGTIIRANWNTFTTALDSMRAGLTIFTDIFQGKWSDIGVQLQRLWSNNWKTIQTIFETALDLTTKAILAVDWRGTGTAVMKQFIRGIIDQAENVVEAIFGAPYAAYQALNRQFGVSTSSNRPYFSSGAYLVAIGNSY